MMEKFILIMYEIFVTIIPTILIVLILGRKKIKKLSVLRVGVICCYLCALYSVTGAGTIYNLIRYGVNIRQINIIPFSNDIDMIVYLLNIIIFIPVGFLFPYYWKKNRELGKTCALGFVITLLIEGSQLLNNRIFDIDDIILNVFGTICGYFGFKVYNKFFLLKSDYEMLAAPITIIGFTFMSRWLLFDEFHVAKVLYGF